MNKTDLEIFIFENKLDIINHAYKIGVEFVDNKKELRRKLMYLITKCEIQFIKFLLNNNFNINKDLDIRKVALFLFNFYEFNL